MLVTGKGLFAGSASLCSEKLVLCKRAELWLSADGISAVIMSQVSFQIIVLQVIYPPAIRTNTENALQCPQ